MPYCWNCGRDVIVGAGFCTHCGAAQQGQAQSPQGQGMPHGCAGQKDPGMAAILGILLGMFGINGIGQIYVGRLGRGLAILFGGPVLLGLLLLLFTLPSMMPDAMPLSLLSIVVAPLIYLSFWAWQAYDAHRLAKMFNEELWSTGRPPW